MATALRRLLRADLRARPGSSLLLGLLVATAAMTLCTTLALRAQMDEPFERVVAQTRSGDVHAATTRPGDATAALAALAHAPGVAEASAVKPVLGVSGRVGDHAADVTLEGLDRPPAVDRPAVRSGRWFGASPGEVVLERTLARAAGLGPGDRFVVTVNGRRRALRVAGTAVTAEVGPFDDDGLAWTTPATVRALGGPSGAALDLRLHAGVTPGAVIAAASPPGATRPELAFYTREEVKRDVSRRIRNVTFLLQANTLLSLLGVAFTIATAIGGRVLSQRRQIGLLKALGLTPAAVTGSLVLAYVAIAAVAAAVGIAGGGLLSHIVLASTADALNTTTPSGFDPGVLIMSYSIVVAAVALATLPPAWRAGRLSTTAALRPQRTHGHESPSRAAGLARSLRLPVAVRFGAKDAFAVPSRAVLTIGSIVLLTIAVVAALSGEATFRRVVDDPALRAKPYELQLTSRAMPAERVRQLAAAHGDDVRAATTYDEERATVAGTRTAVTAGILGDQPQAFRYAVPDGHGLTRPGEALAGRGLLDALGKKVGDTVTVTVLGEPVTLRIAGRHVEPDFDGRILRFLAASLPPRARARMEPNVVLVRLRDKARGPALVRALQREAGGVLDPALTDDEVRQERNDLRPALVAMNVVLLLVAVANLLATLTLGIREREDDLAVFKTLGATPGQLRAAIATVAALMATLAVIVGVPAGLVIFRAMLVASNPSDGPDLHALPGAGALVLGGLAVVAIAVVASTAPARRATRLKPMAVLRAE